VLFLHLHKNGGRKLPAFTRECCFFDENSAIQSALSDFLHKKIEKLYGKRILQSLSVCVTMIKEIGRSGRF
jgi:hypothetical protein